MTTALVEVFEASVLQLIARNYKDFNHITLNYIKSC